MKTNLNSIAIALAVFSMPMAAGAVTINFDALDTSGGQVTGAAVDNYLATFGVTLTNVTAGTDINVRTPPTGDANVVLVSNPNYLAQWWGGINGVSFDLDFGVDVISASVAIPQITSGVTVPSWSITSLDSGGGTLESFGNPSLSGAQAQNVLNFTTPGIRSLRVFSNVQSVAGMGGIPIDDVAFTVPEPSRALLSALGFGILGLRRRRK